MASAEALLADFAEGMELLELETSRAGQTKDAATVKRLLGQPPGGDTSQKKLADRGIETRVAKKYALADGEGYWSESDDEDGGAAFARKMASKDATAEKDEADWLASPEGKRTRVLRMSAMARFTTAPSAVLPAQYLNVLNPF